MLAETLDSTAVDSAPSLRPVCEFVSYHVRVRVDIATGTTRFAPASCECSCEESKTARADGLYELRLQHYLTNVGAAKLPPVPAQAADIE